MKKDVTFSADIDAQEVLAQYELEQTMAARKPKMAYSPFNYLNVRLAPNEQTKTLTIRLLPFSKDGGTCFKKVIMHTIRVNPEVSASGWKTFVCPVNNEDAEGHKMGDACPFCETYAKARELKMASSDEVTKKKYGEVEFINRPKEMWIVRCIERGHEDEGVKFWLFANSKKRDGVFDKIKNLYDQRHSSEARKGRDYNILSILDGSDLVITLNKTSDNKTSIQIIDDDPHSRLAETDEQIEAWVNDDKQWSQVYTVKSYEYMAIIANGGVPMFNKEEGRYIDKIEFESMKKESEAAELAEKLTDSSTKMDGLKAYKPSTPLEFTEDIPF